MSQTVSSFWIWTCICCFFRFWHRRFGHSSMARWRNRSPHEAGEASGEKGEKKRRFIIQYMHKIFLFCALALLESHAEIFCGIVLVKAVYFNLINLIYRHGWQTLSVHVWTPTPYWPVPQASVLTCALDVSHVASSTSNSPTCTRR